MVMSFQWQFLPDLYFLLSACGNEGLKAWGRAQTPDLQ